jgi:hypothetical protein
MGDRACSGNTVIVPYPNHLQTHDDDDSNVYQKTRVDLALKIISLQIFSLRVRKALNCLTCC